jgi:hypothetical protein
MHIKYVINQHHYIKLKIILMLIIKQKNIYTFNTFKLAHGYLCFLVTRSRNCLLYYTSNPLSRWQTSKVMMSQNDLLNNMSLHATLGIAP